VAAPAPSSSEHEFVAVRWSGFAGSRLLSVLQVVRDGRSALSRSVHRDSSWPTSGASSSPSSRRKLRPLAWRAEDVLVRAALPAKIVLSPRKKAESEAARSLRELAAHSSPNTSASLLAQADNLCITCACACTKASYPALYVC